MALAGCDSTTGSVLELKHSNPCAHLQVGQRPRLGDGRVVPLQGLHSTRHQPGGPAPARQPQVRRVLPLQRRHAACAAAASSYVRSQAVRSHQLSHSMAEAAVGLPQIIAPCFHE